MTIVVTNMATGEELERTEIPELLIPGAELSPEWLALANQEEPLR